MLSIDKISQLLIRSDEDNSDYDFAAAAVLISEGGEALHTGIVVKYRNEYTLFHFKPPMEYAELPKGEWYYHKNINFIKPAEIPSFVAHCKLIVKSANPKYGYYFPGAYFADGRYFADIPMAEYMTCVGFCLNVLNGFDINHEYISYSDWPANTTNEKYIKYTLEQFRKAKLLIDENSLKEDIRRITPTEYIASAYINEIPVKKNEIDKILNTVSQAIYNKVAS